MQARSKAAVEAMLQAAARILASEPLQRFTTSRIAKVAGVGIGSVYEYFPDKGEVLAELTERFAEIVRLRMTEILRAQHGVGIGPALETSVATLAEIYDSRSELHRKLLQQVGTLSRANPLALIEAAVREAVADMLRSHAQELLVDDIDVAAAIVCRIGRSIVDAAHSDVYMPLDLSRARGELVIVLRRYLTGRP